MRLAAYDRIAHQEIRQPYASSAVNSDVTKHLPTVGLGKTYTFLLWMMNVAEIEEFTMFRHEP